MIGGVAFEILTGELYESRDGSNQDHIGNFADGLMFEPLEGRKLAGTYFNDQDAFLRRSSSLRRALHVRSNSASGIPDSG
jgi:hypothetical protein